MVRKRPVVEEPSHALAHANMAVAKYWGKKNTLHNIPATPSLSLALSGLDTRTTVILGQSPTDELWVNGQQYSLDARTQALVDGMRALAGKKEHALIKSEQNFPMATGLASSASGFAALVLALDDALGLALPKHSSLGHSLGSWARRASGSAARSVTGGWSELLTDENPWLCATPLIDIALDPMVLICVTQEDPKHVSSREGMRKSMDVSQYSNWMEQCEAAFPKIKQALRMGDWNTLSFLAEQHCDAMHDLMACSGQRYRNAQNRMIMEVVRQSRTRHLKAFYTMDAGPNVAVFCAKEDAEAIKGALKGVSFLKIMMCTRGTHARMIKGEASR